MAPWHNIMKLIHKTYWIILYDTTQQSSRGGNETINDINNKQQATRATYHQRHQQQQQQTKRGHLRRTDNDTGSKATTITYINNMNDRCGGQHHINCINNNSCRDEKNKNDSPSNMQQQLKTTTWRRQDMVLSCPFLPAAVQHATTTQNKSKQHDGDRTWSFPTCRPPNMQQQLKQLPAKQHATTTQNNNMLPMCLSVLLPLPATTSAALAQCLVPPLRF